MWTVFLYFLSLWLHLHHSSILQLLLLGVGPHLIENRGDEGLEPNLAILTDDALRNVRIFLHQTVPNLDHLIVELGRRISPRIARIIDERRPYRIAETGDRRAIGFVNHPTHLLHHQHLLILTDSL